MSQNTTTGKRKWYVLHECCGSHIVRTLKKNEIYLPQIKQTLVRYQKQRRGTIDNTYLPEKKKNGA
jgi:hypothetical protein